MVVGLLLAVVARAQIKVLSPEGLVSKFKKNQGVIYGSTATFGAPYYGERVVGRLMHGVSLHGRAHCTADDYELQVPAGGVEVSGQELVDVVVVRRGKCSFVTKVSVAAKKGAHAVIVIDQEGSTKTPQEIQNEVVSDDGYGDTVKIPSVLISSAEGEQLLDSMKHDPVIVELAWDIPHAAVVLADFWMSSGSSESTEFLTRFKESAEILKFHLQFVPHYHVFSLPPSSGYGRLCTDETAKYCAPDPDGPGPITGADVVEEDLRQLCIWRVTAQADAGMPEGAKYSQVFWEYIFSFYRSCTMSSTKPISTFGKACSEKLMTDLKMPTAKITKCLTQNRTRYLDEQVKNVAWSPQALRLNGWRYSGPLDQEIVLKAICSGYSRPLKECESLLSGFWVNLANKMKNQVENNLTTSTFVWMLVMLALLTVANGYLYRRYLKKVLRRLLREEVMMEVQSQMQDYAKLEDGERRSARGPLSF